MQLLITDPLHVLLGFVANYAAGGFADSDWLFFSNFFGKFQLPAWRQLTQDLEGDGSHPIVHIGWSKKLPSVPVPLSAATSDCPNSVRLGGRFSALLR